MIADDEKMVRIVSQYLMKHDYNVTALNGIDMAGPDIKNIEIILMERKGPDQNDEEVLGRIRAVSNVPVIMLDRKNDVKTRVWFLENGADDYLSAPFTMEEVDARIKVILRRVKEINRAKRQMVYEIRKHYHLP